MTWLRVGDTTFTDPRVQALADADDPRLRNEAFGFLVLVASLSALHQTDYVVDRGTAVMVAGDRADVLLAACQRAGLVEATGRGRTRCWRVVEDPNVLHIRLREAIAWEKQQRADTGNERNRIACLLRDGDACRWCGCVVQPNDQKSGRGRTLDHLVPGQPAGGPDGLVVACRRCNGARGRDWQDEARRATFTTRWPLRQPPAAPYWTPSTTSWLAARGHQVTSCTTAPPAQTGEHDADPHPATAAEPAAAPPQRTGTQSDTARTTSRPGTQSDTARTTSRPGTQPDPARRSDPAPTPRDPHGTSSTSTDVPADPPIPTDPGLQVRVGSGRVGSGGDPRAPDPPVRSPASPPPRRRPRGRRGLSPGAA